MNRKSFFRTLGLGAVAAIVAPKVLAEEMPNDRDWLNQPISFPRGGIVPNDLCGRMTNMSPSRTPLDAIIEMRKKLAEDISGLPEYMRVRRQRSLRYMSGTDWSKILNEKP